MKIRDIVTAWGLCRPSLCATFCVVADSVWMVSLDVTRLLHSFRTNAGVFAGREGGYMTVKKLGGWE